MEAGTVRGKVTREWVSRFFRRCTVEIDTVTGAVLPQQVPALAGSGTETFRTMLASAGWQATVRHDELAIPSPIPDPTVCWTDGDLHALMQRVCAPTNLDTEWRLHLFVVQGRITCSRGKMYDSIGAPRQGAVSYSDDGYPRAQSVTFGAAEGKMQRNVPRAYLRSASHEVVHGFNQIHQEQEGGADNSIMTTTPSVADVLGGPTTGQPGSSPMTSDSRSTPTCGTVELSIEWTAEGVPSTVRNWLSVFVALPTNPGDNDAAATLLQPEVGLWVALGGHAPHLQEAATRLRSLANVAAAADDSSARAQGPCEDTRDCCRTPDRPP
jgi:hypothetical protein